jgi:hypothetical protein
MNDSVFHGGCLCGAVTFEITGALERMVHCHCSRCRRGTGTGHATNFLANPDQLTWLSGEQSIKRFDLPGAKSFAKWFCSNCGCPLPRPSRSGKLIVPAGSLDCAPIGLPTAHIFWGSRAEWACESGGSPTYDTYPASW